jgi:hypothetical protein
MSQHRLFYFMELKEPKAACGLFPSLSWCCYRVEWRPGQKFHDAYRDVGDGVIEVWQDRFVLAADPGGVEYDAGQTDALMAARFKKRSAEAAQDTSHAAISSLSGLICRLSFLKQACARKLSRRTAAQPCCSEPRTGGACLERKMGAALLHFTFLNHPAPA